MKGYFLLLLLVVCGCDPAGLQSPTAVSNPVPVPQTKPPVPTPAPIITRIIEKTVSVPTPIIGDWYLYTQSYGGAVSINQDLTEARCKELMALALPKSDFIDATNLKLKPADGNIRTAECRQ